MTAASTAPQPFCGPEEPQWTETWVRPESVVRLSGLQVRPSLDQRALKRYRQMTDAGQVPPPIKVARVPDGTLYLVDGWHRMAAGALRFNASGTKVRALVAPLSEHATRWQAAAANMAHGVPLKARAYHNVFKSFIRAGQHRKNSEETMSYREIGERLGFGHTTVRNWMKQYFPKLYLAMGAEPRGDPGAGPNHPLRDFREDYFEEAMRVADNLRTGLPKMTETQRYDIVEAMRRVAAAAEALGTAKPEDDF